MVFTQGPKKNRSIPDSKIREWALELEAGTSPLQLYLVCTAEELDSCKVGIERQLGITESYSLDISGSSDRPRLVEALKSLIDEWQDLPKSRILIIVNGFTNYFQGMTQYGEARAGHDYNQDVMLDRELRDFFDTCQKQLIIVTHIDSTFDTETFNKACSSAAGSRYKSDFVELV